VKGPIPAYSSAPLQGQTLRPGGQTECGSHISKSLAKGEFGGTPPPEVQQSWRGPPDDERPSPDAVTLVQTGVTQHQPAHEPASGPRILCPNTTCAGRGRRVSSNDGTRRAISWPSSMQGSGRLTIFWRQRKPAIRVAGAFADGCAVRAYLIAPENNLPTLGSPAFDR